MSNQKAKPVGLFNTHVLKGGRWVPNTNENIKKDFKRKSRLFLTLTLGYKA